MNQSLHVLLIEDSRDDADLLCSALEEGGFDVEALRVETGAELDGALPDGSWDLVISDYHLPRFDGLSALRMVRKADADIPFIMVSGAVGEEFIVDAMRAGAQDFISKNSLVRLVPAVQRELREMEIRIARRTAESALRASEERFRALADNMSQLAWMASDDGTTVWVNKQWTEYTGTRETDLLRSGWQSVIHPDYLERVAASFSRCRDTGEVWDETYPIRSRDGDYRWFLNRAVPLYDEESRLESWFGTCTDITEIRETQNALSKAKEQAEAANRAKSEFLAHMSHELRTPISGIIGMVDVLTTRACDDEQWNYLSMVRESAESLLSIIGEILDLSRIEAGIVELKVMECDLRSEMDLVLTPFRLQALKENLELALTVEAGVPGRVKLDIEKVTQVLRNLVSNAVKYTEHGRIDVKVSVDRGGVAGENLRFTVSDTGVGIPKEKQAAIFESFVRLRKSVTERNVEGTGLGLTISRRLVDFLGGELTVESEPGVGSTFSFTTGFEQAGVDGKARSTPAREGLRGLPPLSILLAEDNRINRMFIEITLREAGHRVTVAENGLEACEAVRNGGEFDLVLMDIQMPVMDGMEAARCIRSLGGRAESLPIIALTAFAMKGDEEKFLEAGMSGHVTKPIDWNSLSRAIRETMSADPA